MATGDGLRKVLDEVHEIAQKERPPTVGLAAALVAVHDAIGASHATTGEELERLAMGLAAVLVVVGAGHAAQLRARGPRDAGGRGAPGPTGPGLRVGVVGLVALTAVRGPVKLREEDSLMPLLIQLLILLLVFALFCWIVNLIPIPGSAPWVRNAVYIVLAIILIYVLLGLLGLVPGGLRIVTH